MPSRPPTIRPRGWVPPVIKARDYNRQRGSSHRRGYDARWRKESVAFLEEPGNRYCCCGCGRVANVVDHRIPHRGDMRLFWDRANWSPMAKPCHDRKTATTDRRTVPQGG